MRFAVAYGIGVSFALLLAGCAFDQQQQPQSHAKTTPQAADHASKPADLEFEAGSKRPPTSKTLYAYAQLLSAQGNNAQSEMLLRKIISDEPRFMPAYCDLAQLQMRQRQIDEARRTLTAGLKISPKEVVLLNDRGMSSLLLRDYASALEDFSHAASLAPDDARYRSNMALALAMLGRYDESLALYTQIMALADAQHNVTVLREARGDFAPPPVAIAPIVEPEPLAAVAVAPKPAPEIQAPVIEPVVQEDEIQSIAIVDGSDEILEPVADANDLSDDVIEQDDSQNVVVADATDDTLELVDEVDDTPVETVVTPVDNHVAIVVDAMDILPEEVVTPNSAPDFDDLYDNAVVKSAAVASVNSIASDDDDELRRIKFHDNFSVEIADPAIDEPIPTVVVTPPAEVAPDSNDVDDAQANDVAEFEDTGEVAVAH